MREETRVEQYRIRTPPTTARIAPLKSHPDVLNTGAMIRSHRIAVV
jgi:hypothetical protein